MKAFTKRGYRLSDAAVDVKIAYTGFLAFALVGYATLLLIALLRVGPGYDAIVTHYRGSELEEAAFPRTFGQLLEDAHFHAFIEGVVLLVLAHLFAATSVSGRLKGWVILAAFGATFTDLACPWLIRYAAPQFAVLQQASWATIGASAALLIGVPIYDMWFRPRPPHLQPKRVRERKE